MIELECTIESAIEYVIDEFDINDLKYIDPNWEFGKDIADLNRDSIEFKELVCERLLSISKQHYGILKNVAILFCIMF